jgi:tripartite-type tricarboxylate transporter receptor subunit TctC
MRQSIFHATVTALLFAGYLGGAAAEEVYRGKTIRLVVASTAGGGYDYYGRTFVQFMRRHIPGEPNIVVQNMPGGGGLQGLNWLFNIAPKDGTVIAMLQRGTPFYPYFGDPNAKFTPTELNWLGSVTGEAGTTAVWHSSSVKTIDDAFRHTVLLGGSGPNDSETYSNLMNNTIDTRFRIVQGYKSNSDTLLAMERGEVDGITGSWSSLKSQRPNWISNKQVNVLVQVARARQPDLPNVPLVTDYVTDSEHKVMWDVMLAMATVGRPLAAPPGVPAALVQALRAAFDATARDPAFIAEMERTSRELTPENAAEIMRLLHEVSSVRRETLATLINYTRHSKPGIK